MTDDVKAQPCGLRLFACMRSKPPVPCLLMDFRPAEHAAGCTCMSSCSAPQLSRLKPEPHTANELGNTGGERNASLPVTAGTERVTDEERREESRPAARLHRAYR
ncbi:MAG: hypothetical protein DBY37_10330 [Desulfovibrionaceae bacterium]|nr:MAG: hypothetical protein DBY37_10330 [Desulfovibrionaceae bacterium]